MSRQGETGYKRIISAAGYSLKGLTSAYRNEAAFRQEAVLALLLVPAALWLGDTNVERAILIASLVLVIITELMNSAVEAIVDRIGPEHHELSGRAKDMGSAAVFISLINVVVIWAIIIFK